MPQLRHFLYRDDPLIQDYLAQVEGGIFEEEKQTTRTDRGSKLGGSAKAGPLGAEAGRTRGQSEETESVIRQTGASQFDRLYTWLANNDSLQYLENIDETIWQQIRRGELVELDAVVKPTGLSKLAELFDIFEAILPIGQAMDPELGEIDAEGLKILRGVQQLSAVTGKDAVEVVASLAAVQRFEFGITLKSGALLVDPSELEGEVTVFGKIQRKLKEGEEHMLEAVFGGLEQMLDEKQQQDFAKMWADPQLKAVGLASPLLRYPAAILIPIAIYR